MSTGIIGQNYAPEAVERRRRHEELARNLDNMRLLAMSIRKEVAIGGLDPSAIVALNRELGSVQQIIRETRAATR